MKKLNSKGYMLVEVILASILAFSVAFLIISLTIKLKNKNDDLFVDTEVVTDRAIISNKLMSYIKSEGKNFDCSKLIKDNNSIVYNGNVIDIVTDYADIGTIECHPNASDKANGDDKEVNINIPISIKQMPDKDYSVKLNYKFEIGDLIKPTCILGQSDNSVTFTSKSDDTKEFGLIKLVDNGGTVYNNVSSLPLEEGTFIGFVKDEYNNYNSCTFTYVAPDAPATPAPTYTISFESYGGSYCSPITGIKKGDKLPGPLCRPALSGYTFLGWYWQEGCGFDPNWYINAYTDLYITYHGNPWASLNHWITYGINEGRLSNYCNLNYGTVLADYYYGVDHDITLYASWLPNSSNQTPNSQMVCNKAHCGTYDSKSICENYLGSNAGECTKHGTGWDCWIYSNCRYQ